MIQDFQDNTVLVITGATASGKASLAHKIARECGGEVIVADSMKVYRNADILTSKPPPEHLKEVRYHLIDIIEPDRWYDAGSFCRTARSVIDNLHRKNKLPVVAGGTALYVTSLMEGIADIPPLDEEVEKNLELEPTGELYRQLKDQDPERASEIHPNMRKRIIRALGVFIQTGKKMSELLKKTSPPPYNFAALRISWEREELYSRINRRVDRMCSMGIEKETEKLLEKYGRGAPVFEGLGYGEIASYIKGELSFEEAVEAIKKTTRNYARRQLTWWRNRDIIKLDGRKLKAAGIIS